MTFTGAVDRSTRAFWQVTGRRVDLDGPEAWLRAPVHDGSEVADRWLEAYARSIDGTVAEGSPDAGLLPSMTLLDGPGFASDGLRPEVRDFYERTSHWRMEVWTQWNPLLQPAGELVAAWFGRRVRQLTIPTRPLDVARGMDSRIVQVLGADGTQVGAGWLRTLRSTGAYVYSGCYRTTTLPGAERPSVHVSFPLEHGNVQVFLQPRVLPGGALGLVSAHGPFRTDGAYVTVAGRTGVRAARVPLHETFRVFVDDEGVLRTDHVLRLRRTVAVRLHYRMERVG